MPCKYLMYKAFKLMQLNVHNLIKQLCHLHEIMDDDNHPIDAILYCKFKMSQLEGEKFVKIVPLQILMFIVTTNQNHFATDEVD